MNLKTEITKLHYTKKPKGILFKLLKFFSLFYGFGSGLKNFLYDIYITEGTRTVLVKGFLDTGNELREPVTNLPCIIVENTYFNQFEIADDKKFIIKYDTINEVGEVRGFKGQNIMIRNEEANNWRKVEAIICGCERKLSKEDEFQALLSRGIV